MIYPQVSLEDWCERYGIKPIRRACRGCGKVFETTIPVATKKCRGLVSELHECGEQYRIKALKPIDKDFLDLLNSF